MNKINVCFFLSSAYPLFNRNVKMIFGGAEINLYYLAQKLSENPDYEVTFYVGDYGQKDIELYGNIKVKKLKYLPVLSNKGVETSSSFFGKIKRELFLCKEIFFSKGDVYINSCGGSLVTHLVVLAQYMRRKKVIFRLASDTDAAVTKFPNRKLMSHIYRFGLRHVSAIVAQTEKQQSLLKANHYLESTVIKNGFYIKDISELKNKSTILWVSRSVEMKRPWLFVELAKRLPDEKFIMIMPGINETTSKVKKLIENLDNFKFIEHVPFFDIQCYYDNAKLFVNTSEYEGFPNSFIQACLSGTPILSFNVNPDNIINEYNLGCYCNDDIEEAVNFIKSLDNERLYEYSKNANSYVKKNHDICKSALQYEKLINTLLKR